MTLEEAIGVFVLFKIETHDKTMYVLSDEYVVARKIIDEHLTTWQIQILGAAALNMGQAKSGKLMEFFDNDDEPA